MASLLEGDGIIIGRASACECVEFGFERLANLSSRPTIPPSTNYPNNTSRKVYRKDDKYKRLISSFHPSLLNPPESSTNTPAQPYHKLSRPLPILILTTSSFHHYLNSKHSDYFIPTPTLTHV